MDSSRPQQEGKPAVSRHADVLSHRFFDRPALEAAPALLGRVLETETEEGVVSARLTEVEAYEGEADPASHAFRGPTPRNATMYGAAGHAYVYVIYGMHYCVNLVCRGSGTAAAVLVRAGEIIEGVALARSRRGRSRDRDLARGPARLCQALAIHRPHDGADICDPVGAIRVREGTTVPPSLVRTSPRTGVVAARDEPWRFFVHDEPTVSPYRAHVPRVRTPGRPRLSGRGGSQDPARWKGGPAVRDGGATAV